MKLDEAIEIKERYYITNKFYTSEEFDEADLLSIEALKRLKFGRNHPSGWELEPLPGETK